MLCITTVSSSLMWINTGYKIILRSNRHSRPRFKEDTLEDPRRTIVVTFSID